MTIRRLVITILILSAMCPLPVLLQTAASGQAPQPNLRVTMDHLFDALTMIFPLSLSPHQFQAPQNRPQVLHAFQALSEHAASLATHQQHSPRLFAFLGRSLHRDTHNAMQHYQQGDYEAARFLFRRLTADCVACHSRLPSAHAFDLGKHFIDRLPIATLPVREQVRLAVSARQFNLALEICERHFHDLTVSATQIDLSGLFEDYLRIAIRVEDALARARETLETFQGRDDVPFYLAPHLTSWISALRDLRDYEPPDDEMNRASRYVQMAQQQNRYLADRQGLVYFIAASRLLYEVIDADGTSPLKLAEAYYLLGVAESHIARSSWLSETEFFLETAIRLAPDSPFAKRAYAFLEAYMWAEYTGSSGTRLPPEVQIHLAGLRSLLG